MRSSAVVAGRGFDHDTDSPDIHTASEAYARRFTGGGRVALIRQAECLEHMLGAMNAGPLRVLDVGGGHAQTTETMLAHGHDVVVQGSAASCFQRLAPLARAQPDRLTGCASSLLTLPFADGSFDLVMALRLMAHVTRWRELLTEMLRVTRRYLVIDFPILSGAQRLAGILFRLKMRVEGNTRPFFLYNRRDVLHHLRSFGAAPTAEEGELVLPMALHRMLGSPDASIRAEMFLSRVGLRALWGSPVLLLVTKGAVPASAGDERSIPRPASETAGLPSTTASPGGAPSALRDR